MQIDNKVFDLLADVRKQYYKSGGYVYTIRLVENKTIKASPKQRGQALLKNSGNALTNNSISHSPSVVNSDSKFEEIDKNYLEAVNRGDMETVQRMVDEAAEKPCSKARFVVKQKTNRMSSC